MHRNTGYSNIKIHLIPIIKKTKISTIISSNYVDFVHLFYALSTHEEYAAFEMLPF